MISTTARATLLSAALTMLLGACAAGGQVYEERITERNGIETECGVGPGLEPCRDIDGETYPEELNQDAYVGTESTEELASDAERIRKESPEAAEETTEELEREQWSN